MTSQHWRYAAASAIGTSHLRDESICQDSHDGAVVVAANGIETLIIAASDGAGSASLSHVGSHFACKSFVSYAVAFLKEGRGIQEITREVAGTWLEATRLALTGMASSLGLDAREFACTILFVVASSSDAAFLQIGDGAICVHETADAEDWSWVFWPQKGEYANTTRFLTDPKSLSYMEFAVGPRQVGEVAVFTDGLEGLALHFRSRSTHAPFFNAMLQPLRKSAVIGFDEPLSEQLTKYLLSTTITSRTDDDKTLIVGIVSDPPASVA